MDKSLGFHVHVLIWRLWPLEMGCGGGQGRAGGRGLLVFCMPWPHKEIPISRKPGWLLLRMVAQVIHLVRRAWRKKTAALYWLFVCSSRWTGGGRGRATSSLIPSPFHHPPGQEGHTCNREGNKRRQERKYMVVYAMVTVVIACLCWAPCRGRWHRVVAAKKDVTGLG